MDLQLIDRPSVARKLGMTVEKFYRRYAELRALAINPFPGPVLGNQSGARWDPRAIDRWIEAGGEHATQPPAPATSLTATDTQTERERAKAARKARAAQLAATA